jgi:RNA-directed DNA polymerase
MHWTRRWSVGPCSHAGAWEPERIASFGSIVFPSHRRVKPRKVVEATRRLGERFDAWRAGRISFGEFDATVQGWIAHVHYADSWGLREHVLKPFVW